MSRFPVHCRLMADHPAHEHDTPSGTFWCPGGVTCRIPQCAGAALPSELCHGHQSPGGGSC